MLDSKELDKLLGALEKQKKNPGSGRRMAGNTFCTPPLGWMAAAGRMKSRNRTQVGALTLTKWRQSAA